MNKSIFDGYAKSYDDWFIKNENVFYSELKLLYKSMKDLKKDKILSMGSGSGLFELALKKEYSIDVTTCVEPSTDMANIARKRGFEIEINTSEDYEYKKDFYDIIYLNGSSSYIKDLEVAYSNAYKGLKKGGHLILLDVPLDSSYGILYKFAGYVGNYDSKIFSKMMPKVPYPIDLVKLGTFYTSKEKVDILENKLNMKNIRYMQTLLTNPVDGNSVVEEVIDGYNKGGYVSIIAEK